MKIKVVSIVSALALLLMDPFPCRAEDGEPPPDLNVSPEDVIADAVVVRPCCLVATIVGSALFVISLPFAIPAKSVHRSAHALISRPAYSTFKRPLGDLSDL
jgi:hypothetical protein